MTASLCLSVPILSARAWACGWIDDVDLFTGPHVPEAIYIATLPDLDAWRRVLPQMVQLYRAGARAIVLRTYTPAVVKHITKWGGLPTHIDPSGRVRFWCGPEPVRRYFGRIAQKSAAIAGVTSSR